MTEFTEKTNEVGDRDLPGRDNATLEGNFSDGTEKISKIEMEAAEIAAAQEAFANASIEEKEKFLEEYVADSQANGMLCLNLLSLKRRFPLAINKAKEYITFKSHAPQTEDSLTGIFLYGPRTILYEFFDDNKVFINISGLETKWNYEIHFEGNTDISKEYPLRLLAEKAAFEDAFGVLEN